jgi:hypothetical protein
MGVPKVLRFLSPFSVTISAMTHGPKIRISPIKRFRHNDDNSNRNGIFGTFPNFRDSLVSVLDFYSLEANPTDTKMKRAQRRGASGERCWLTRFGSVAAPVARMAAMNLTRQSTCVVESGPTLRMSAQFCPQQAVTRSFPG